MVAVVVGGGGRRRGGVHISDRKGGGGERLSLGVQPGEKKRRSWREEEEAK